MSESNPPSVSTSSWLDYIVFGLSGVLFNSVYHNTETTPNESLDFAMKDSQDFHTALYLAPKQKNPDPRAPSRSAMRS